jgi:Tropinone reductase 1
MTQSAWQLRGRNALVTGGTRGIGRAIVSELRELGASVTLIARTQANVDAAVASSATASPASPAT